MARLLTCGFEAGFFLAETSEMGGMFVNSTTTNGYSTAHVRSGQYSMVVTGGAPGEDNWGLNVNTATTVLAGNTIFMRTPVYITAMPSTGDMIVASWQNGAAGSQVNIDNNGVLNMQDWSTNGTQYSCGVMPLNQWLVIEHSYTPTTGASSIRLNGVLVGSGVVETFTSTGSPQIAFAPSGTVTMYYDDIAINDSTGTQQNGWPGLGGVFFMRGTSDAARVGVTTGAAGTTNLFAAVNQAPSTAVAQASATATSQLEDATSNTTDYYEANIESANTYGAGIPKGAMPVLAQGWCSHGNSTATQRTNGISVPTGTPIIAETTGLTPAVAAGAWPTGWVTLQTVYSYFPTINSNNGCYLKWRKGTASTDYAMVASMALMVEYLAPQVKPATVLRQATMRATTR